MDSRGIKRWNWNGREYNGIWGEARSSYGSVSGLEQQDDVLIESLVWNGGGRSVIFRGEGVRLSGGT